MLRQGDTVYEWGLHLDSSALSSAHSSLFSLHFSDDQVGAQAELEE